MPSLKVLDEQTGQQRDLKPDEVSQLIDEGYILNEAGADLLTRWLTKTFSANPQEAAAFLKRRGFQVMPGENGEIAIRNPNLDTVLGADNNQWKVLDPKGGFEWADAVDVAYDVFISGPLIGAATLGGAGAGAAVGALGGPVGAAVGAGAGAMAGGGSGSAAAETIRQKIGKGLGVNINEDPQAVEQAAKVGTVLPTVGGAILRLAAKFPKALLQAGRFANKKAAALSRNILSKVAGTSEEEITTVAGSQALTKRVLKEQASPAIELLDRMRGTIATLRDKANLFPETREMASILEKARPVPLRGLMKILKQERISPVGKERVAVRSARQMAEQIAHKYGFKDANEAALGSVTAKEAQEIKRTLQDQVAFGKFEDKFIETILKRAQGSLRSRIVQSIPTSQARSRYQALNGYGSFTDSQGRFNYGKGQVGKMEALNELEKRLGEHKKTGTAETFIESVTKGGRNQDRRLVEQFDRLFGTKFVEEGQATRLVKKFSGDVPRITATGMILGVGPGAAVGGAIGGAPGAVTGAGAGLMLATPKGAAGGARLVTKTEEAVRGIIRTSGRSLGKVERRVRPISDYLADHGITPEALPGAAVPSAAQERLEEQP